MWKIAPTPEKITLLAFLFIAILNNRFAKSETSEEIILQQQREILRAAGANVQDALPCGAVKDLGMNESVLIESPNFNSSDNYPSSLNCKWRFLFPSCSLTVSCPSFRLNNFLCFDYLEIKDGSEKTHRFCGTNGPNNMKMVGHSVDITFRTSPFFNSGGFRCQLVCVDDTTGGDDTEETPPENVAPPTPCNCGQGLQATKIVNGVETQIGEFPWMVGLVRTGSQTPFCGGALINNKYILTAAHCVMGRTPFNTEIILNEHNTQVEDETPTPVQRRKIDLILPHRSYSSRLDYDAAVIKLRDPVDLSNSIVPICLPKDYNETYVDKVTTVSGWGVTEEGGSLSPFLQKVDVDVITNEKCSEAYPDIITPRMICASRLKSDACQGDSGGPLMYAESSSPSTNTNRIFDSDLSLRNVAYFRHTQVGVVSFGQGCARPDKPGVYSRVTEYMPWLLRVTADGSYCTS